MQKWSKRNQVPQKDLASLNSYSAQDSDEADLVEENGEDVVNIPIISLLQADGLILVNPYEVKIQVYCNDTIETLIGIGEVDLIAQIRRRPLITTVEQLQRQESGDGEASGALNMHEATKVLEQHVQDQKVNIYRKSIMMRREKIDSNHNDDDFLITLICLACFRHLAHNITRMTHKTLQFGRLQMRL